MRISSVSIFLFLSVFFTTSCGSGLTEAPTAISETKPVDSASGVLKEAPTQVPNESTMEVVPTATRANEPTEPSTPTKSSVATTVPERDLDIVTLLPPDAIRSIDSPDFFVTPEEADVFYGDGEYVLGVEINGDARAYSVPLLSSHEIVNDVVGGEPIAVTW